jgi:hypothetical protein
MLLSSSHSGFDLGRFEMVQAVANKLDTMVSYPTYLDMQPFATSSILKQRYNRQMHLSAHSTAKDASNLYELYAIVCHMGKIQARAMHFQTPSTHCHEGFS